MIRANDKDLATLRAGMRVEIEREVREEVTRESMDRLFSRLGVAEVHLVQAAALAPGDVLVECAHGDYFYEHGTIAEISTTHDGKPVAGDIWLTVRDTRGGYYGTAKRNTDVVLRKYRYQRGI